MNVLTGRTFGPYELQDMLGRGGMGAVYRAYHRTLQQHRAIKILPPHFAADENFVERFRREAMIAAGLRHPNIVQIYDVGEEGDLHYIVMELVEGRSLREVTRSLGPLQPDYAVRLLKQLADALDYAHGREVLHRDIKPGNVIVAPDDHLTLVDFGIARAANETRLTRTGLMVGTPEYMAPEVVTGAGSGKSADLYALGVLAYEMFTGHVPFGGTDTPAVIYAQVHKPPPSPRSFRADLPDAVEGALLRQLAKEPAERFPTARGFVEALAAEERPAERLAAGWSTRIEPATPLAPDGSRVSAPTLTPPPMAAPSAVSTPAPPTVRGYGEEATAPGRAVDQTITRVERRGISPLFPALAVVVLVALGALALFQMSVISIGVTETPKPAGGPTLAPAVQPVEAAKPAEVAVAPPQAETSKAPTPTTVAPTATVAPGPAAPGPQQRLQQAQAALAAGDFQTGLPTLLALKQTDPGLPGLDAALYKASIDYGKILLDLGNLDGSYAQYGAALGLRANDPAALDGQKQVVLLKDWREMEAAWGKDDEAAITALEQIMQVDPNYRETRQKLYALLVSKADRLLSGGDRDAAFPVLMRALEVNPDGAEARQRLAAYTPTPTVESPSTPGGPVRPSQPAQPAPKPAQPSQPAPAPGQPRPFAPGL